MPENLYPKLPSASMMSQESFNIETIRKYYQDITDLKNKYHEKQQKYKRVYNKLLYVSSGPSSIAMLSGITAVPTALTVIGIPISVSLGAFSTASTCIGAVLLLHPKSTRKNY